MKHSNHIPPSRDLDEHDIHAILARNTVGRLAFVRGDHLDVLPIQYVYREGKLYGRTRSGGKLDSMAPQGTRVAFEVDEIRSAHNWRTVLTHGTLEVVDPSSGQDWDHALGTVRRLFPAMLHEDDPTPDRTEIFKIVIESASGRAIG